MMSAQLEHELAFRDLLGRQQPEVLVGMEPGDLIIGR